MRADNEHCVKVWLLVWRAYVCSLMLTHVYCRLIMLTSVHLCLLMFTSARLRLLMSTCVYLCLLAVTCVYLCLRMYTYVVFSGTRLSGLQADAYCRRPLIAYVLCPMSCPISYVLCLLAGG